MTSRRELLRTLARWGAAVPMGPVVAAAGPSPKVDADIRQAVDEVVRAHGIAGMAIAITQGGQHHFHNVGVASKATGHPVSSDTLFEIGSVSKTFTATLATHAQATGRLSLTDGPARFLPELEGSEIGRVELLHLATHTAGGFPLQVPDGIDTREQLMAYLRAWRPQYPAGTARTYANPSIGLLGVVAAQAWARPFAEAMQAGLFPALGLRDTWLQVPERALPRYAQGYNKADAPVRVNPGMLADEAYGVKTSARDLVRFVDVNLGIAKVEPPLAQAVSAAQTGYFKLGAMTQALVWEVYDEPVALGDLVEGNASRVALETHAVERLDPPRAPGAAAWVNKTGSTNGFGAYVAFLPAKRAGVVLLANRNYPNEARVRLAHRILQALAG